MTNFGKVNDCSFNLPIVYTPEHEYILHSNFLSKETIDLKINTCAFFLDINIYIFYYCF